MTTTASEVLLPGSGRVHVCWHPNDGVAPRARRHYIDRVLRQTLSVHVGRDPAELRFGREPAGRPYLLDVADPPEFNLSDTDGGTVVAVAQGLRVGIDLERLDRRPRSQALAQRYFHPEEARALAGLDDDHAARSFLHLWTAKESSCKATGTGIYGWLDRWQFDVVEGHPQLLGLPAEAGERSTWSHRRIEPAPGYTAVVSCAGTIVSMQLRS